MAAAAAVLQRIYERNVHHGMSITWGSYPSFLDHDRGSGCFRCHNSYLVSEAGEAIGQDCTLCHSMLAYESEAPFEFLEPVAEKAPEGQMHEFLRREFMGSYE